MMWKKYRFLILRRVSQISIIALYIAANLYGLKVLEGNLSSSLILGTIPMSDPFATLQMFAAGAVLSFDVIIGAAVVLFVYGLFLGRAFCSFVCPMNIVTDLANFLRKFTGLNKLERSFYLSRNVRYWALGLSLALSFAFALPAFEFVSPISMLHRGLVFGMGFGWAAILAVFLFDLFVHRNGFCGHICPLGGFYSAISKYSLLRVEHDSEKCTQCMKCKEVCPETQVLGLIGKNSGLVTGGECINCGRCIEVCDDDALGFTIRSFTEFKQEK
jgi:ferredoxin-type protein NapH